MSALDTYVEEGRRLGLEEGKQLGIEQGKQLGIEEGIKTGEKQAKFLAIHNLRNIGLTDEQICQALSLTIDELQNF